MSAYRWSIFTVNLLIGLTYLSGLYMTSLLINHYLLPNIDFASSYFSSFPYTNLGVSLPGLFTAILGLFGGLTASRPVLIIHALLLAVIFLVQLGAIFTGVQLRSDLDNKILHQISQYDPGEVINNYFTLGGWHKDRLDELQRTYGCCGLVKFNTGYLDWQKDSSNLAASSVPQSCCLEERMTCGDGVAVKVNLHHIIYTHGCLAVLQRRLERSLNPILVGFIALGVLVAILEVIAIVLSAAYTASISRQIKKNFWEDQRNFRQGSCSIPPTFVGGESRPNFPENHSISKMVEYLEQPKVYEPTDEKGTVI